MKTLPKYIIHKMEKHSKLKKKAEQLKVEIEDWYKNQMKNKEELEWEKNKLVKEVVLELEKKNARPETIFRKKEQLIRVLKKLESTNR